MGYQITFKYYPKKDKGFDHDSQKEFTKHIGKEDEDTPIEQVAMAIRAEYARRDILVHDAELYEYTKKKVRLKEIRGGLFIKDKKIMFDELPDKAASTEKITPSPTSLSYPGLDTHPNNASVSVSTSETVSVPHVNMKPLRHEFYYPPYSLVGTPALPPDMTPGKKYAIFEDVVKGKERGVDVRYYRVYNNKGTSITLKEDMFSESFDPDYFTKPNIVMAPGGDSSVELAPISSDMYLRKRR